MDNVLRQWQNKLRSRIEICQGIFKYYFFNFLFYFILFYFFGNQLIAKTEGDHQQASYMY